MEENNKNVATNRQFGLYLGEFSYEKVIKPFVWSNFLFGLIAPLIR